MLLLVATACRGPFPPPPAHAPPTLIPCSSASLRITLTANSVLDHSCTYSAGFEITASGVTLDCRGATIDGTGVGGVGIEVSAPAGADLSGVTIRNCDVRGFLNSIRVTRVGFRSLVAGHEYDHGISGVVIEDTTVGGSHGVGIYVDAYVTRTTIRHVTVAGAGSSGIYLEAGSTDNVVEHNTIRDNGFVENGPGGQPTTFGGQRFRFWGVGREGISIDGSRRNRVVDNTFSGNSAGGVFLYTNCGEDVHSSSGTWFPRRYGAEGNLIADNRFVGGVNGVWVAARMGENLLPMDCSDPSYFTAGLTRISLDRAAGNTVAHNTFYDVVYGVRVEDDATVVTANRFVGADAGSYAVVVGTPYRTTVLHQPVRGTVVTANRATITGNSSPFRWVDGEAATTFSENTSAGVPVGWCQSIDLPRGPFVFVIALAYEPAGSPVTPTPPLKVPEVGPQAPCA